MTDLTSLRERLEKATGGPAFPRSDAGYSPTQDGMSLRDYFAATSPAPGDLGVAFAEALTGRTHPHKTATVGLADVRATIETIKFWAEAEARYRYIKADAMLVVRALESKEAQS